jgi:hypothetical protein
MTNAQVFFYVAISAILLIGAYAIFLAVMLDRLLKENKQLRKLAELWKPPF